ncbi:formylglycine-generating enzyme family protein [Microbacterium sp.]|uniref:formylglycine-generating enzyme family protein n=1 Tax=Microbacterium sp. TaxID=51671 RepID=UPI00391B56A7
MSDVEMARIPAGRVLRGDQRGAERREIAVDAFEIGVYPITEEQLAELLGIPARHPRRPATQLSWLRAIRLCNALSEWEGLDPVYSFDGEVVTPDAETDGFRLPTEDEWEYACRAGSTNAAYGPVREVAWTAADGIRGPVDVGARLPNLHGLFDTLGNVWEWCFDPFDAESENDARAVRGGGWSDAPAFVRATARRGGRPREAFDDVGVRVARGPMPAAS